MLLGDWSQSWLPRGSRVLRPIQLGNQRKLHQWLRQGQHDKLWEIKSNIDDDSKYRFTTKNQRTSKSLGRKSQRFADGSFPNPSTRLRIVWRYCSGQTRPFRRTDFGQFGTYDGRLIFRKIFLESGKFLEVFNLSWTISRSWIHLLEGVSSHHYTQVDLCRSSKKDIFQDLFISPGTKIAGEFFTSRNKRST